MGHIVLQHTKEGDIYRLVVGDVVEEREVLIEVDENGTELEEPRTETERVCVAVEDFVFAADDKRWNGKSLDSIAKSQRRMVKRALAEREDPEPVVRESMPREGEAL